ncbi:unnamed protein product [Linum tenue]|uniref:PHD-type domain-containing protein n=1 Tax=Linum tenue TaxID=586396 RepID=A0AAV0RXH5_9ROSI|nr:unnamed protein product [Linum tenue]
MVLKGMVREGGMSNGSDMDGRGKCLMSEVVNGFGSNNGEGLRTYKRKKLTASSSESKDQGDVSVSGEAVGKLADQEIMKEPQDHHAGSQADLASSSDVSRGQWRNYILEQMYRSLSDDEGGIQGCIQDVLRTLKVSDGCDRDRCKSSKKVWLSYGTPNLAKKYHGGKSNEASYEPNHRTVTDMCRLAFHGIISSEKFTSLCKLLFENFHESRADNLFSLSLINRRMKDGAYENSPWLFSEDIQQFWKKLEGIGTELIFLAKSLSDVSKTCFKDQLPTRESDSSGKADETATTTHCTCRHCGSKADGSDCLVCDSCEDMYHISCIEPAVEKIPPKSWYCSSCLAIGMGSHENCVVCEKLSAPISALDNQPPMPTVLQTNEEAFSDFDQVSEESKDDPHQLSEGTEPLNPCKICGSEVESGGKVKICEHPFCPNKYYHVRCLTAKQLNSYGPRWYCPSCLCRSCLTDKDDDKIVLCDACDSGYHIYCMSPPQSSIPKGRWFCRQCVVKLQKVRRERKAYENREGKRCFDGMHRKSKRKIEDMVDGREGINLLLNAVFIEDKLAGEQTRG